MMEEIINNVIADLNKKDFSFNIEEIKNEVKESPKIKKLEEEIEYLKVVKGVFDGTI